MMHSHVDYDSVAELYDHYVTADYDFAFFQAEIEKTRGAVLELTAGTGRLSLPLIEAGARLTCMDSAQGMLDVLRRKLDARGLEAELICADIARLRLPARFELAILPFQSFMEILGEANQRATLAAVLGCLEPGGRFICTMHNPAVRRRQVDGLLRVVGQFPVGEDTLVVSGFEQGGQPVVSRLQFFELFGPDGRLLWKRLLAMAFAFVEHDAFAAMAHGAGFEVTALYGDYDRRPFDPITSPVMIWVLGKGSG